MPPDQELLTAEQVASVLQVTRDTVYRYIRDGKLAAFRKGRSYRIPCRALYTFLATTRVRPDIELRNYTGEQVAQFLEDDQLTGEASVIARRFEEATAGVSENRWQEPLTRIASP